MSKNAKELLQTELVQAKEQLANLDRQLQHRPDFGLGEGSPEIITWEMNLARRNVLTQRIEEIEQALERDSTGDYGICEYCGTEIDPERLRILPHTRRCVRCANIPMGSKPPAYVEEKALE
ncbi:MAG: TraR/DksA C4-type zinc finger protein [Caldilineae bacterium]|nr:TraR/DksA C4-type zinc finger protein [Anaerolineae bacterium]MCB0199220.1 TraR/DksA C4-type zinc finger protein [Anaerolineae bacterium]MCB0204035.1 TraR/DksA C4-type zinc finger protein [Anaerolineae bacterium]MCB0253149.1 TraR/DksA C4-type zinc finger protein [Anaerolineae bacterium]MCB9153392.1 TraR/DksA C4-type zinc finger protein [Caldilineae bacterium]